VRWYQAAVAAHPRNAAAWVNLGVALVYSADIDAAVDALKVAIQLDRKFAATKLNLGPLLENGGDVNGAVAAYKKRLKDSPSFIIPNNLIFRTYFGLQRNPDLVLSPSGDVNGQIAELKEAIEFDQKSWWLHYALGSVLMAHDDVDGAIAAY